jgi:outer membrane immunogenic protein
MKISQFLQAATIVVAVSAVGSVAQAQDGRAPIWSGAYVGLDIGGESGKFSGNAFNGFAAANSETVKSSGANLGVYAGYNWQAGSVIYGIEGDANASGSKYSRSSGGATLSLSNDSLISLRGRLGYAAGPALFYATAGVASAGSKIEVTAPGTKVTFKDNTTGYVVGLGVDYAISSNVIARLEGLHYGFNDLFKDDRPAGTNAKFEANVIRAGIAYKF